MPCLLLAACSPSNSAVDGPEMADYVRAESFLAPNTAPLVTGQIEAFYWQDDGRLLYRSRDDFGYVYKEVDPASGSRRELLDRERLAAALSETTASIDATEDGFYTVADLQLSRLRLDGIGPQEALHFRFEGANYRVDLSSYRLDRLPADNPDEFPSPDGRRAAFINDHNLWLRDTVTDRLSQLTVDGEQDYGYGTNNAGWLRDDRPVLLWSPDSRAIATFRHDGRQVGEMYLYDTRVGHPRLDLWKYPLPGDEHIFMIERLVIHLGSSTGGTDSVTAPTPRMVRFDMPPDPHRSTTADHVADFDGTFLDVQWREDGRELAFVSSSRDHKVAQLRVANTETGAVRDILREESATYYESGSITQNWRVLWQRGEVIWFSERDGWGHLYLYDLASGDLKRRLTAGDWPVLQLQQVDEAGGWIYFTAAGREGSERGEGSEGDGGDDPYFHYLYRLSLDDEGDSEPQLLTPQPAHHSISWSPNGQYFVDSYSTPVQPGASVLYDLQRIVQDGDGDSSSGSGLPSSSLTLEQTDITALQRAGWVPPEQFTVKARDQLTDLHGLMYTPSDFDPARSYPVLNYLYPGPQAGSVGSRAFRASRLDKQAVAELGFVVVELDATCTPGRSKAFHDACYGDMGDNGLPDQIAAIRQLAAERPWMDIDRVGIWGHSGGGFASTAGILRYPEFYKVAVSSAGNHDNRNYEDDWGEKWQGLLEVHPETGTTTNYDSQANQLLAHRLQGKLLLAHGMLDDNVHPSSTLLMVDALMEAEKDFDLLLLPNARHGFGNSRYFMLKRWNYFVEHLIGTDPPQDFRFADNIP